MSLFTGTPATSYTTSTTETPKWMQDAIFSQIQSATNVANQPYTPYAGKTVAGLTPQQEAAYRGAVEGQGAWVPAMNQAMVSAGGLTDSYGATEAANPYLQAAGQSSTSNISSYMNPYQQGALDVIAKQGARNLSENLLPGVSDSFIKAGQFGGTRMGEFGSRALRDTQEAVLNQQAQMINQGYTQAVGASQADLSRLAQLGQVSGNLASTDLTRQLQAGQQLGALTQASQGMRTADLAALEASGTAYQNQAQREMDASKAAHTEAQLYPRQTLDWMSTQIRGMSPITPQSTTQQSTGNTGASPLAQLASATTAGLGLYNTFNK